MKKLYINIQIETEMEKVYKYYSDQQDNSYLLEFERMVPIQYL